ncbi:MAG TPA: hypothetical protein VII05_05635 [Gaiellaceae bacterium]|jgi:hypothetical protein
MNDDTMEHDGNGIREGVLRFPSLDTGDLVLAVARAVEGGQVSLSLGHQMDGELEIFMDPAIAEELALALARAADRARESAEEDEE